METKLQMKALPFIDTIPPGAAAAAPASALTRCHLLPVEATHDTRSHAYDAGRELHGSFSRSE